MNPDISTWLCLGTFTVITRIPPPPGEVILAARYLLRLPVAPPVAITNRGSVPRAIDDVQVGLVLKVNKVVWPLRPPPIPMARESIVNLISVFIIIVLKGLKDNPKRRSFSYPSPGKRKKENLYFSHLWGLFLRNICLILLPQNNNLYSRIYFPIYVISYIRKHLLFFIYIVISHAALYNWLIMAKK
jgi:hypothetical protein